MRPAGAPTTSWAFRPRHLTPTPLFAALAMKVEDVRDGGDQQEGIK